MNRLVDDLQARHLAFEKEQVHLLTVLYGIVTGRSDSPAHLAVAKCLELMKSSTLILDDFLDKSTERHGTRSLFAELGPEEAVLTAELLKSSASIALALALDGVPNVSSATRQNCLMLFEDTYRTVCLGQLEDMRLAKHMLIDWRPSEQDYWSMIHKTTAVFIQLPLLIGSALMGLEQGVTGALYDYGLNLGLAYQVRDDVLDVLGDGSASGKPRGGDIREKKARLPLIRGLAAATADQAQDIRGALAQAVPSTQDIERVLEILLATKAVDSCAGDIVRLTGDAVHAVQGMVDSDMAHQLSDAASILIPPMNL